MGAFAKFLDARRQSHRSADNSFEHFSGPASRLVGQVFEAAIRRFLEEENPAKAERMQMMLREFEEGRDAS